jgi:hypothetical protein
MTHLCCTACGLRFDEAHVAPTGECPKCDRPLTARTAAEAIGFRLGGVAAPSRISHAALAAALRKPPAPPSPPSPS